MQLFIALINKIQFIDQHEISFNPHLMILHTFYVESSQPSRYGGGKKFLVDMTVRLLEWDPLDKTPFYQQNQLTIRYRS